MGRYYSGDIEGKFWFAIQSSNAASRFHEDAQQEPGCIPYCFNIYMLPEIQEELKNIETLLGENLEKFDAFFKTNNFYNDNMLINAGLPKNLLSEYADYKLGKKIEDCLLQNGICSFDADL